MTLRRYLMPALAVSLIALVGVLYMRTRPAPVLTLMTWPGAYGRAQASAQLRPYAALKNVDMRQTLWDGDLSEVSAMVEKHQYKADVIDFELPTAAAACRQGLLEKIDPAFLPPGANQMPAARDFVPGAIGPCWVGSMVYSQVIVYSPRLKRAPASLADFFDRRKFPGPRVLSRAAPKFNLELALLADGVAPADIYKSLETPEGVERAYTRLIALKPVWAKSSADAMTMVKDGKAAMATGLNGDVPAPLADHVIWDHQLYEMDVFAIPRGNPKKDQALDFIAYATASAPLAEAANWVGYGPARRSAIALVKNNPETAQPMRPLLPTAPEHFANAFAIDEDWWLTHGAGMAPRWREFTGQ